MRINFDKAFDLVIGHEGGFQDDPKDRGNWTTGIIGRGENRGTKYGVTAMSYPDEDIRNLTVEKAKEIYLRDFWLKASCDDLPAGVDYLVFDASINHGRLKAVQFLQRAVGAKDDGAIGKETLGRISKTPLDSIIDEFVVQRQLFYSALSTFKTYGKGWTRRNVLSHRQAKEQF